MNLIIYIKINILNESDYIFAVWKQHTQFECKSGCLYLFVCLLVDKGQWYIDICQTRLKSGDLWDKMEIMFMQQTTSFFSAEGWLKPKEKLHKIHMYEMKVHNITFCIIT